MAKIVLCPVCDYECDINEFLKHLDYHECKCGDFHNKKKVPCNLVNYWINQCSLCKEECEGGRALLNHWRFVHCCGSCGYVTCICRDADLANHDNWMLEMEKQLAQLKDDDDDMDVTLIPQKRKADRNDDDNILPATPPKRERQSNENIVNDGQIPSTSRSPPPATTQTNVSENNSALKRIPIETDAGEDWLYTQGSDDDDDNDDDDDDDDDESLRSKLRKRYHALRQGRCPFCPETFTRFGKKRKDMTFKHISDFHKEQLGGGWMKKATPRLKLTLNQSVFKGSIREYTVNVMDHHITDTNVLFHAIKDQYENLMNDKNRPFPCVRMHFDMVIYFYKEHPDGSTTYHKGGFYSIHYTIENEIYSKIAFQLSRDNMQVRVEDFLSMSSGMRINKIIEFKMYVSECTPLSAGSHMVLPPVLKYKSGALVNVPSEDGLCFVRCIMAKLFAHEISPSHRRQSLEQNTFYKDRWHRSGLDLSGLTFPLAHDKIYDFEKKNSRFGINLFVYDGDLDEEDDLARIVAKPGRKTHDEQMLIWRKIRSNLQIKQLVKEEKEIVVDLLMYLKDDGAHYMWIEKLPSLIRHPRKGGTAACPYCLHVLKEELNMHLAKCQSLDKMVTFLPEEDEKMYFNQFSKCIPTPFLATADFESILLRMKERENANRIRKHIPAGYAWTISNETRTRNEKGKIEVDRKLYKLNKYTAAYDEDNVASKMFDELIYEAKEIQKTMKKWNDIANQEREKQLEGIGPCPIDAVCGFCNRMIDIENEQPVRQHQHYPPYQFEFYAHNRCNLQAKTSPKLVVLVHNLKGYDSHFLLKAVGKLHHKIQVDICATSPEKIFALHIGNYLSFVDSFNFFSSSLDSVTNSMNKETEFPLTREYFDNTYNNPEITKLMLEKGIYPYDYMSSLSKYDETQLPPRMAFRDRLKPNKNLKKDYARAQTVWKMLRIKDMREYTEVYNLQDCLLLLDAFNGHRDVFIEHLGLEPATHLSLPHLSWNCAFKHILAEPDKEEDAYLDYITDEDMHVWLESGKRGGVATGGELRYAEADNKYLNGVGKGKESTYLMAFDVNNMYGAAICSYLPVKNFEWIRGDKWNEISADPTKYILDQKDEQDEGYFFEVDLEFPGETHDKFIGITPVPYHRKVGFNELSPEQQQLAKETGISKSSLKTPRLMTDLYPRKNYVCHYRALRFYLEQGVKLTKLHRGISFYQRPVLRSYIEKLTKKRADATSTFEKNMWKLACNAIYGKSVENIRKRSRFVVLRNREQALRYMKKPSVANIMYLNKDGEDEIAIVRLKKTSVTLDRPLYLGLTVLDESKKILYDWIYNYAMKKWPNGRFKTIATDTDSVYCLVRTECIYKDIFEDKKDQFDMSDYPTDSIFKDFHCKENCKRLGMMKDENAGKVMKMMVYLKPKMYSYVSVSPFQEGKEQEQFNVAKAKGKDKCLAKLYCTPEEYMRVLEEGGTLTVHGLRIRSYGHEIFTEEFAKKALCSFDLKRYYLPGGLLSVPFGHYTITKSDNAVIGDETPFLNVIYEEEDILKNIENEMSNIDDYDPADLF